MVLIFVTFTLISAVNTGNALDIPPNFKIAWAESLGTFEHKPQLNSYIVQMDSRTCTHQQQSVQGSNQYQKIIKCTQCNKVLLVYHQAAYPHLVCRHVNAWGVLALNKSSDLLERGPGACPSTEPQTTSGACLSTEPQTASGACPSTEPQTTSGACPSTEPQTEPILQLRAELAESRETIHELQGQLKILHHQTQAMQQRLDDKITEVDAIMNAGIDWETALLEGKSPIARKWKKLLVLLVVQRVWSRFAPLVEDSMGQQGWILTRDQ